MLQWLTYFMYTSIIAIWGISSICLILLPIFTGKKLWLIPFGFILLISGYTTEVYFLNAHH